MSETLNVPEVHENSAHQKSPTHPDLMFEVACINHAHATALATPSTGWQVVNESRYLELLEQSLLC